MRTSYYSKDEIQLRAFLDTDEPFLRAVFDRARRDELALAGISFGGVQEGYSTLREPAQSQLTLATLGPIVIGFVNFSVYEILRIYVDPAHQGRGVANKLLRHALDQINGSVDAEILAGNERALTLFFRHGFEVLRPTAIEIPEARAVCHGYMLQRKAPSIGAS